MISPPPHPYQCHLAVRVRISTGNPVTRENTLGSGKRGQKHTEGRKKKDEKINLVTIKPLTVLTANPQIHKHTEGVLGIKAFN